MDTSALRRTAAQARDDQGLVARPHDPHRRGEGRAHPRRWRVAHPRCRIGPKASRRACQDCRRQGWLRLPASAVDGFSRVACTEALPDERAVTAIGCLFRARVWFAAHGITRLTQIVTDNCPCYRPRLTRAVCSSSHAIKQQAVHAPTQRQWSNATNQRLLAHELHYAHPGASRSAAATPSPAG